MLSCRCRAELLRRRRRVLRLIEHRSGMMRILRIHRRLLLRVRMLGGMLRILLRMRRMRLMRRMRWMMMRHSRLRRWLSLLLLMNGRGETRIPRRRLVHRRYRITLLIVLLLTDS